jgi:trimeric autotransporter adhesin
MLAALTLPMTIALGAASEMGQGVGASTGVGAAIAALEGAGAGAVGGAVQGEIAAFAPGKGTGGGWPGATKGTEQLAAGNESFKASWQSMLRAWGAVTSASSGAAHGAAGKAGEIGAEDGNGLPESAQYASAPLARAGVEAAQSAQTTNRSNGPAVGAGAPANHAARAVRLRSLVNAASKGSNGAANLEANAQSATAVDATKNVSSSTGVSAGANVKSERRARAGEDAVAHAQAIPEANGPQASQGDGAVLVIPVAPVQPQFTPANLADSLGFRPAKKVDEPSSDANRTEPEAGIAAIRTKGSPGTAATTATAAATDSRAITRAASPISASTAQGSMRDEETSGEAPASIGEQEESAAQPPYSTTEPAIAAPGPSRARSASRSAGKDANSGIKEHKALPGDFTPHRGTSTLNGVSVGSAVATASADKVSVDSGALPMQQSMARSAHEAVAGGASAATGQGIGTNVVLGHTSAPDASAWVRDPVNVHGTAGATAGHGDSPVTQAAAPQETFATLDAGTSVGTPNWIHAGGHQAEAGFEDPALGWVGVRADLSGGSVHAALVPGSTEAAQTLSGHLAGLSTYLAEQQTPVATLTMAAPGTSGTEAGVDQSMQQSAGQHGEQNPAAAQQSVEQPGAGALATTASATTTNASFDAIAYAGGSRGTHISVMA